MRALLFFLCFIGSAAAQVPICSEPREGMTACFEGRLCRCRFEAGGQLTGRPDAHRWDCGVLRPDCRPAPATLPQPDAPPWPQYIPPPQIWIGPTQRR